MWRFFDPMFQQFWSEIGLALVCGFLVGLERELRGKATGIRTCMLFVLGTAMFVRLGILLSADHNDPTRVLGQVVTGIGFLGGGVIFVKGDVVSGVTTASVVWMLAAIGALIGARHFAAALTVSLLTVAILVGIDHLERIIKQLRGDTPKKDRNA